MISRNLLRMVILIAVAIAAISFFSYAKRHSHPACTSECIQKDEKDNEEGNSKGDLFIWESITRNLASYR